MIKLTACDCGSSEQLIRQALHKYEYRKWATEPLIQGKSRSLSMVEELIRKYPDNMDLKALYSHINNNGKWCVILGVSDSAVKWADISRRDMKSDVEAEIIVNNFN